MAVRRKFDIIIVIALVLAAMAYGASRSEFRLRSDMPVEFFDGSRLPPLKRASEEKIAKAYWSCVAKDEAIRRHYWLQLRTIWNISSAWKNQFEWSSISFRQSLRAAGEWWGRVTRNMMGQ